MRNFLKKSTFILSLFMVSSMIASKGHCSADLFRQIPIPEEEHGYGQIQSIILKSKADFQQFLKESEKHVWNQRQKFLDALNAEKIDFASESLALLFFSEGSSSVKIGNPNAKLKGSNLVISVSRELPEGPGTGDMAYYGFSFVVKKKSIKEISLKVGQLRPIILKIQE